MSFTVPARTSSGIERQRLPPVQFAPGPLGPARRIGLTNGSRRPSAPMRGFATTAAAGAGVGAAAGVLTGGLAAALVALAAAGFAWPTACVFAPFLVVPPFFEATAPAVTGTLPGAALGATGLFLAAGDAPVLLAPAAAPATGGCWIPTALVAPPFLLETTVPVAVPPGADVPAAFFLLLGTPVVVSAALATDFFAPAACFVAGEPFVGGVGVADGALPAGCCPPELELPAPVVCAAAIVAMAVTSARM